MEAVYGLEYTARQWQAEHSRYLKLTNVKCFLYWKSDGTIDRMKTAQEMILNKSINIRKRFNIACVYCLEESVQTLWHEMESSSREENFLEIDDPIEKFWIKRIRDEPQAHWTQALVEQFGQFDLLESPIRYRKISVFHLCHLEGFQFFSWGLSDIKRDYVLHFFESLESRPIIPKHTFSTFSSLFPLLQPHDRQRLFSFIQSAELNDLRSCMCTVTKEEEEQILALNEEDFARKLLCIYLIWPAQSLFIEIADKLWNYMYFTDFQVMLMIILEFKKKRRDFDYGKLLDEFWNRSPEYFRYSVIWTEELCKELDVRMDENGEIIKGI